MTMTHPQIEDAREQWRLNHAAHDAALAQLRAATSRAATGLIAAILNRLEAAMSLPAETVPVRRVDVAARRRMNTDRNHVVRRAARRQRIARRAAA